MAGVILHAGMLVAVVLVVAGGVPASAKDYTVGDSSGWTTGVDYGAWAKGNAFNIGDTLFFQYNSVHSVAEVSAADHGACSASKPLRVYKDQSTTIALTRPGTRYFICGTAGHCASGMKLAVTVSSHSGASGGSSVPGAGGARLARPSSERGNEAPSDAAPADSAAPVVTTTTKDSSNTSGAGDAGGSHAAFFALLLLAAGLLAMMG